MEMRFPAGGKHLICGAATSTSINPAELPSESVGLGGGGAIFSVADLRFLLNRAIR